MYKLDHESIANRRCSLQIAQFLLEVTTNPKFNREYICRNCDNWRASDGLVSKPMRPFAVPGSGPDEQGRESCNGCAFSYLDAPPQREPRKVRVTRGRVRMLRVIG